jgi:hypothetical protein
MNTVIRGLSLRLFNYWKTPVTGRPGRSFQNHHFNLVIGTQDWLSPSPESYGNGLQTENSKLITDLHTTGIIQIPIVFRHTEIPCLHPAVSSLGACPTPAR